MHPLGWLTLLGYASYTSAVNVLESSALETCQADSRFTAKLFEFQLTPNNNNIYFDIVGASTIDGNVLAQVDVVAYGYQILSEVLDPCELKIAGLCPMSSGQLNIKSDVKVPSDVLSQIPAIAYGVPDLDGLVTVRITDKNTGAKLACVQTRLSNGKTVYQDGVGWSTACVAGLALLVSAIVSGLGHSNTAAHIAANTLSLFSYFQGQALFGMTAVDLPPIVAAWTQNFQWSMGLIRVGFIQSIASWYQQATGGSPSTILSSLLTTSVNVQKRSLINGVDLAKRATRKLSYNSFVPRAASSSNNGGVVTVHGIERVGFRANIELTNIFMTGYIFFVIFILLIVLGVIIFRWALEAFVRSGKLKSEKFLEFRHGWTTILRGILFRLILIGFPQMVVLCFWEFSKRDSGGEQALATVTVVTMILMLLWACTKVVLLARKSIAMHSNPAYILYSDPVCLHKWGFLYVQFKATSYWFIIPSLIYILIKGIFVALFQNSGTVQAIAIVVLEACALLSVVILRPYMDKKTNAFNISIAAVNLLSAIFLLFFTDIFGLPGLVVGVMGVVFFVLNAVFALVLIILVLIATTFAIFSKNPDTRYQPLQDDRGSFIKSQTHLMTELDALGATARGDTKSPFRTRVGDDDSHSANSWEVHGGHAYQQISQPYHNTNNKELGVTTAYEGGRYTRSPVLGTTAQFLQPPSRSATSSPWQRGAGYDR